MKQKIAAVLLFAASAALGQIANDKKPAAAGATPGSQFADELARRLSAGLHVKTAVGEPIKVGSVTLIPNRYDGR